MIHYIDHRQLTAAYLTSDGRLLLNDEPLPDEFPATRCLLADWDVELKIFKLTGERGAQLPSAPAMREALRTTLRCAIASPLQAITLREAKLREAADAYVNQIPIMTDASYDAEWREHKQSRLDQPWLFDPAHPRRLFPDGSILDRVGAAPSANSGFARVKHGNPMKSINDVFEGDGVAQYDELLAFVREMERKLGVNAWPMLVEPKVDGMAVKLIYRNGLLDLAVTRGDGEVGDDITENVMTTQMVPLSIAPDEPASGTRSHPLRGEVEIIGEVYMPLAEFTAANAARAKAGLDLWANPRNAASGSMKLQDAGELRKRPLAFVRHDNCTPWVDGMPAVSVAEVMNWDELVAQVAEVRHTDYTYAIDGAVVKIPEGHGRDVLGIGTRAPNWACAFKFKPEQVTTILEGIDVQVGRTGVLTPVARLKPVLIDGTTVSQATLNNEAWIQEKGLQIGDEVVLQKAGAIIPEIVASKTYREVESELVRKVTAPNYPLDTCDVAKTLARSRPPFSLVDHLGGKCPCCGSTELQKQEVAKGEGAKWCCTSTTCPAQLSARIEHFCSRGCLDIEGIGKEMSIAIAEDMGLKDIRDPMDLFQWKVEDLMAMTWVTDSGGSMTFGESRAIKAVKKFHEAKQLPLHRWIRALGISSVGENTSKEITRLYATPEELVILSDCNHPIHATSARIAAISLIDAGADKTAEPLSQFAISSHLGPVSCRKLLEFSGSASGREALCALHTWGVKSDNYDPTPKASDTTPLFGKTFAITGTLSVGRDAMKALIESKGGKVSGSVSKSTNFLVAGEGGGQKADKARAAGVVILDEAALRAML